MTTDRPHCALLPALRHRLSALDGFLRDLPVDRGLEERARQLARDQFRQVLTETTRECDRLVAATSDPADLMDGLRPLLHHFASVTRIAHETFSRGSRGVPTILVRAVQRELDLLKLSEVQSMLRIGPPNDFVTDTMPLWNSIYDDDLYPELESPDQSLFLFGVPPVEGLRALWMPITVGHEVAHVLNEQRGLITDQLIATWISEHDLSDDSATLDPSLLTLFGETQDQRLFRVRSTLLDWGREVFCDLYAALRFGPAALAAQAEMLASVSVDIEYGITTHPPASFRIGVLMNQLGDPPKCYGDLWNAWQNWCRDEAEAEFGPDVEFLLRVLKSNMSAIERIVRGAVPSTYATGGRAEVVNQLANWLEAGVPQTEARNGSRVLSEDVLNAGWIAYYRRSISSEAEGPTLEQIDALTAKALDDLDFVHIVAPETSKIPNVMRGPFASFSDASSILSAEEVIDELDRALESDARDSTLVVTPLQGSLKAAGATVDLRVGKGFIVFRRSSTTSFDAISAEENPRSIQEFIELDWGEKFVLHPGELVLAATLEYLRVPMGMTGQVVTRSSYGRLGLITATAVQVQPGYTGCLTLELVNLGQVPMTLTPGERIAQLLLMRLNGSPKALHTKYRYPTGPEFSRVSSDEDLIRLKPRKPSRGL